MGSEMCIRDRDKPARAPRSAAGETASRPRQARAPKSAASSTDRACLLYTSDAADERSSVDLGGRRIIKKKT